MHHATSSHSGRAVFWLAAIVPATAHGHVSVETVEVLAGALHPWINPDTALVLIGLSLWLAQAATATEIRPFIIVGVAVATGVASGLLLDVATPSWLIHSLATAVGLCVALRWLPRLPLQWFGAGCLSLVSGVYAGVDAAADMPSPAAFVTGALFGGLVFPLALTALMPAQPPRVLQIGLRVLGSWLAAIGLMLVALR